MAKSAWKSALVTATLLGCTMCYVVQLEPWETWYDNCDLYYWDHEYLHEAKVYHISKEDRPDYCLHGPWGSNNNLLEIAFNFTERIRAVHIHFRVWASCEIYNRGIRFYWDGTMEQYYRRSNNLECKPATWQEVTHSNWSTCISGYDFPHCFREGEFWHYDLPAGVYQYSWVGNLEYTHYLNNWAIDHFSVYYEPVTEEPTNNPSSSPTHTSHPTTNPSYAPSLPPSLAPTQSPVSAPVPEQMFFTLNSTGANDKGNKNRNTDAMAASIISFIVCLTILVLGVAGVAYIRRRKARCVRPQEQPETQHKQPPLVFPDSISKERRARRVPPAPPAKPKSPPKHKAPRKKSKEHGLEDSTAGILSREIQENIELAVADGNDSDEGDDNAEIDPYDNIEGLEHECGETLSSIAVTVNDLKESSQGRALPIPRMEDEENEEGLMEKAKDIEHVVSDDIDLAVRKMSEGDLLETPDGETEGNDVLG